MSLLALSVFAVATVGICGLGALVWLAIQGTEEDLGQRVNFAGMHFED